MITSDIASIRDQLLSSIQRSIQPTWIATISYHPQIPEVAWDVCQQIGIARQERYSMDSSNLSDLIRCRHWHSDPGGLAIWGASQKSRESNVKSSDTVLESSIAARISPASEWTTDLVLMIIRYRSLLEAWLTWFGVTFPNTTQWRMLHIAISNR